MFDIKYLKSIIEGKINKCDRVVIVPHNNADFDPIDSFQALVPILFNPGTVNAGLFSQCLFFIINRPAPSFVGWFFPFLDIDCFGF